MINTNTHIISKVGWKTSFSNKENAGELQQRLSAWSRFQMPRYINTVFDEMCPPSQTWAINTLELNLGVIEYNNLETELSARLVNLLHEKLTDIIFYADKLGSGNITITDQLTSEFHLVEAFLLNGMMPWSYKIAQGSVDKLLENQLKFNRQNIIGLIRKSGTDENVRTRIAWQFSNSIVHKIIEELEPSSHSEIGRFSDELTNLQQREGIVKSGRSDFKKNLLLWTLTYLLVERGTFFNKLAFIKSSLKQMADHYNIRHKELLQLIEIAVEKQEASGMIKFNFLKILQILSKESKEIKIMITNDNIFIDYWAKLKTLFKHSSQRRSGKEKKELNELIVNLYQEDPSRFLSLLQSPGEPGSWWTNLLKDISVASVQVMFTSVNPANAAVLIQVIDVLHGAAKLQNLGIDRKILLHAGLQFLLNHRNATFSNSEFTRHVINDIGRIKGIPQAKLYTLFSISLLQASLRNEVASEVYDGLANSSRSALSHTGTVAFRDQLHELFGKIKYSDVISIVAFKETLHCSLHFNPHAFMDSLLSYPDKKLLETIILPELSVDEINILLKRYENEKSRLFLFFIKMLNEAEGNKHSSIQQLLNEALPEFAISAILFHPQLSPKKFIQHILKDVVFKFNAELLAEFYLVLEPLAKQKNEKLPLLGDALKPLIASGYLKNRYRFKPPVVSRLIKCAAVPAKKNLELLASNYNDAYVSNLFDRNSESARHLLDHLFKNGSSLMDKLVKEYYSLLKQDDSVASIVTENQLRKLLWEALVKSCNHSIGPAQIRRTFAIAVSSHYQLKNSAVKEEISKHFEIIPGRLIGQQDDGNMEQDELFNLVGKAMLSNVHAVKYKRETYELEFLISSLIKKTPGRFRKLISGSRSLQKSIAQIRVGIAFGEFSLWIMSDLENESSVAMTQLHLLHDLSESLLQEQMSSEIEGQFWNIAGEIIGKKANPVASVEKLALAVFDQFKLNSRGTPSYMAAQINRMDFRQDSVLLKAIYQTFPAVIPLTKTKEGNQPTGLTEIARKGLLNELTTQLIATMQVPPWYKPRINVSAEKLLMQVMEHYPYKSLMILRQANLNMKQIEWLNNKIGFNFFTKALKIVEKALQPKLHALEEFYKTLGRLDIRGVSSKDLEAILFKKVITAFHNNNWRIVSAESMLNELLWELTIMYGISKERFVEDVNIQRALFPASLQAAFSMLFSNFNSTAGIRKKQDVILGNRMQTTGIKNNNALAEHECIIIKNAGIVILNNYIPLLFERLGIVAGNRFVEPEAQTDAVHYLQYLVTGLTQTEEFLLPLNKILCGLPLHVPVKSGVEIFAEHKVLMDGLIKAAINYWPVIGNTSLNGFRGNWLVRDGQLKESDEYWQLLVDKKSYDVLIGKLPFSFSVIKFPWMSKPLKVTWPY
ncbi:MAG: hypothetical protein IPP72_16895 [Chitinophagaceae bacterium]|nr:hypothetical protein [Chitinophagaceae bacterium]